MLDKGFLKGFAGSVVSNLFITQAMTVRDESGRPAMDHQLRQIFPLGLALFALIQGLKQQNSFYLGVAIGMIGILSLRYAAGCFDMQDPSCKAFTLAGFSIR